MFTGTEGRPDGRRHAGRPQGPLPLLRRGGSRVHPPARSLLQGKRHFLPYIASRSNISFLVIVIGVSFSDKSYRDITVVTLGSTYVNILL